MTTVRPDATGQLQAEPSHLRLLVCIAITLSAFFCSFALAIHQPPGRRRWSCLPAVLSGPALHAFALAQRTLFPPSFLLWIWTFTVVIWTFHATSILYIEQSVVFHPVAGGVNWLAVRKGWNNPRRIAVTGTGTSSSSPSPHSPSARARFVLGQMLVVLVLGAIWAAGFFVCVFTLKIRPRDLDPPVYFHFSLDRAWLIRVVSVLQWVWSCYFILTTAHAAVSLVFVGVLALDSPEEWPPLWGDIRASSSIRAFWGKFWHRIGTASQLSYARALIKAIGLRQGSAPAKALASLCVFAFSGLTHIAANWAVNNGHGQEREALFRDVVFLLLNFTGGLAEVLIGKLVQVICASLGLDMHTGRSRLSMRYLGFAWVFCFFFCTVPPYQYPFLQQALKGFLPDVRISVHQGPFHKPIAWEEYHSLYGASM